MKRLTSILFSLFLALTSLQATELLTHLSNDEMSLKQMGQAIDQLDRHYTARHRAGYFNGNVLIAVKGVPVYNKSFGFANKSTGEKLMPNSTFQLASTSKPFTAAAILMLYEEGKLDLSDPVSKFFPGFPYSGVDVRQLLCHRSGLPNYFHFAKKYTNKQYISNQDLVDMMIRHKPGALAYPNRVFKYNNTNYALLAAIVEHISGQSFASFCEERIFKPLEMYDTWVWHPTQKHREGQTYGYSSGWVPRQPDLFDGVSGDKGIYSTTEDLLKWDKAWFENSILKPETIALAYEGQSKLANGADYGLGWRMTELDDSKKMVYHNGWWHNYNIVFKRFLNDSTTIIIFSNKYNQGVYKTATVERILFDNFRMDTYEREPVYFASSQPDNTRSKPSTEQIMMEREQQIQVALQPHPFTSDVVVEVSRTVTHQVAAQKTEPKADTKIYTVRRGDTLYRIAQRFDVSIDNIKQWNELATARILTGQQLQILQ